MVWHFIGVYIINRTLHDRLEIRNLSSRVEKYFTSERNIFQHSKRNFVSSGGHKHKFSRNIKVNKSRVSERTVFICGDNDRTANISISL